MRRLNVEMTQIVPITLSYTKMSPLSTSGDTVKRQRGYIWNEKVIIPTNYLISKYFTVSYN